MHPNGKELVEKLRERRRKGLLNNEVNVAFYEDANDLIVNCDCGRLRRPLVIVENGKLFLTTKYIEDIKKGKKKWIDLINEGIVEYIDAEEEENTLNCIKKKKILLLIIHIWKWIQCVYLV